MDGSQSVGSLSVHGESGVEDPLFGDAGFQRQLVRRVALFADRQQCSKASWGFDEIAAPDAKVGAPSSTPS